MWFVHAVEYYSALKKEGNSDTCTRGMNLKDIMLSEMSQTWKDRYCTNPLRSDTFKFIETERGMVVARGGGESCVEVGVSGAK